MNKKQIRLSEEKLRDFISYSVARLLKEGMGRDIYLSNGEYDGGEGSMYGSSSTVISFNPFDDDAMMRAFEFALDDDKYRGLTLDMFDEGGQFGDIWPVRVDVEFNAKEGMRSGSYDVPDDPDEIEITGWESGMKDPGAIGQLVNDAIEAYLEMYFDKDELWGAVNEEKENRGITYHNDGNSSWKPKNPYEGMSWDEYCETKKKEREGKKEEDPERGMGAPKNHGITYHNPGPEADKDAFRPKSIHITRDDLKEMINKAIGQVTEGMGWNDPFRNYDRWKTSHTPYDTEDVCTEEEFFDMIREDQNFSDFLDWLKNFYPDVYEIVDKEMQESYESPIEIAINNGVDWKVICRDFFELKPIARNREDSIPDPRSIRGLD